MRSLLGTLVFVLACTLFICTGSAEAATLRMTVRGVVTDSITGEKLSFVNVSVEGTRYGCLTDGRGAFEMSVPAKESTVIVTSMGYAPWKIVVRPGKLINLKVRLQPGAIELSEVMVKPKRRKYSKKNNPAVQLMERIRHGADNYNPEKEDFYTFDKYEKMSIGLDGFNPAKGELRLPKKFSFLKEYADTNRITGDSVLIISIKERLATELYRRDPTCRKTVVTADRSEGIDQGFNQENIQTFLRDVLREIDIYGNDITLMQNRFVSPLSAIASNYYKFFITDTVMLAGNKCAVLSFVPHNPQSFGFNGRLYVPLIDSIPYVKRVEMRVPKSINLNYVTDLVVMQEYEVDSVGKRRKTIDDLALNFRILPGTPKLYARKLTLFDDFSYNQNSDFASYYNKEGDTHVLTGTDRRSDSFWHEQRMDTLSNGESLMKTMIGRLRKVPVFYWSEKILSVVVKGYVPTGNPSKIDLGPVNTMISGNTVEGMRFRVGGMTTANLSRRWYARAYGAYGTNDHKWKYSGELEYSFEDHKYHSREFPMHALRLNHTYDVDMIGQHYLFTNADNVFLALKRMPSDKATYRRLTTFDYILEKRNGFSIQAGIRHEIQQPTRWLPFIDGTGQSFRHFTQSAFTLKLRYSPGETFYQAASMRIPINMDSPVFMITHEFGPKGMLGADFTVNKTEISVQKRFWFSAFGYTDLILKGGKIWSQVQYPALAWPNANLSYTIQPESFALMNPMEFATDYYASWDATYWINGALLNRIPILNKLKLREVVAFRGYWGGLTKKNNPAYNENLYRFPTDAQVQTLGKLPYMEISAGLDNILTVLRVDYVWRLSYRNTPGVSKGGVRIAMHFTF